MTDIQTTLAERGTRYGAFTDHAGICQALKRVMKGTDGWGRLNDAQMQALETIADKIARILNGDPNYGDNWHDIQGYAKLVENTLDAESAAREWLGWYGDLETPSGRVEVRLRDETLLEGPAESFRWSISSHCTNGMDIVAYRLLSEP